MFWKWCWGWWRNGDDHLTGTSGRDWMFGGRGDDVMDGAGGNDLLSGGRGNDTLYGGGGKDLVFGGSGNDIIDGGHGNDRIWGGSGNDDILGGAGRDKIKGGWGNDTIDGGDDNDRIWGGRGNDTINGGHGNDHIRGGGGNDTIDGGAGCDTVKGGWGDDTVDGGADSDWVHAGSGDDTGIYNVTQNLGSHDYYNGGRGGSDHLMLQMTGAQAAAAATELDAYRALLDGGHHGRSFQFETFDLKVKNWETVEVVITNEDEGTAGAVAVNDTIPEDAIVIPAEVENAIEIVEPNADLGGLEMFDPAKFALDINRSDFRIASTSKNDPVDNPPGDARDVENALLPRVFITAALSSMGDVDVYAFDLMENEIITLDIDDTATVSQNTLSTPDTYISIVDSMGATVNDGTSGGNSSPMVGGEGSETPSDAYLVHTATFTGTHYVVVQDFFGGTGSYTLNASIEPTDGNPTKLGGFEVLADTLLENDGGLTEIVSVANAINGSAELTDSGDVFFVSDDSNFASSFEYTATDALGNESTATATMNGETIVATAENPDPVGTSANELFIGSAEDNVFTGDDGNDAFVFGQGPGDDQITDFMVGTDALILTEGLMIDNIMEQNSNMDSLVNFDTGGSVLLVGVADITDEDILA